MTSPDPDPTTGPNASDPVPAGRLRWWDRLAGARIDLSPLRSREFALLFASGGTNYLCATFAMVALPFQLYALTGSNLAVGAMGVVQLVPTVVFGLWGGALADRVDRRAMLLITGAVSTVLMVALMINAMLPDPQVWLLYVVGALSAASNGLNRPSKEALIPLVVKFRQLPAAVAMSGLTFQLGMLVGPGIAGVLLAQFSASLCYGIAVVGLAGGTAILLGLRRHPPEQEVEKASAASDLRNIVSGLRYAVSRKDLLGTYLIDMVGMIMAIPIVLFPALAEHVFARPELLGLLYSAEAVGSMLFTLTSGWVKHVHHHGRGVAIAAMGWGGFVGLAGLMPDIWLAIVCFGVAGAFDQMSGVFRGTIWHQTIPTEVRGRLAGIEMLSYMTGPLGGQLRAGVVADTFGVRNSIVSGGILCVIGVAGTTAALRGFWAYDARTDPHAVAQRERREAAERAADNPMGNEVR